MSSSLKYQKQMEMEESGVVTPPAPVVTLAVPDDNPPKSDKPGKRYLGLILTLLAALQFSGVWVTVKMLSYHPLNLGIWRFSLMTLVTIPIVILKGRQSNKAGFFTEIWPPNKTLACLLLQAVLYCNAVMLLCYALFHVTMGDSTVILNSGPVFVTIIAWAFLGEACGIIPVISGLVALIGVGIICKPPIFTGSSSAASNDNDAWNVETLKGVAFSFSSMMLFALCFVLVRNLRKVHYSLVQFTLCFWGFLQSVVMAYLLQVISVPKDWYEVGLIVASSAFGFGAQAVLTLALKWEQAGVVALVKTMEVPFIYFLQTLVFHHEPDIFSVVGAVILQMCVIIAALRKTIMALPEENRIRKIFRFLLL